MLSVISNSCSKDPRLPREPIKSGDPRSGIRGANQKSPTITHGDMRVNYYKLTLGTQE